MLQIYIGSLDNPSFYFEDEDIFEAPSTQSLSLIGQELSVDTFSPIVADRKGSEKNVLLFRSSDGKVIECSDGELFAVDVEESSHPSELVILPSGTPVWYFQNRELVGKFYLENVTRTGKTKYQLNCVSLIGRLDKMQHSGGLYFNTTVGDVIKNILR
jgi:hypothetical protein